MNRRKAAYAAGAGVAIVAVIIVLLLVGAAFLNPKQAASQPTPPTCGSGWAIEPAYSIHPASSLLSWERWDPNPNGSGTLIVSVTTQNGTMPSFGATNSSSFTLNLSVQRVDPDNIGCGALLGVSTPKGSLVSTQWVSPGGFYTNPGGSTGTLAGASLNDSRSLTFPVGYATSFSIYPTFVLDSPGCQACTDPMFVNFVVTQNIPG